MELLGVTQSCRIGNRKLTAGMIDFAERYALGQLQLVKSKKIESPLSAENIAENTLRRMARSRVRTLFFAPSAVLPSSLRSSFNYVTKLIFHVGHGPRPNHQGQHEGRRRGPG